MRRGVMTFPDVLTFVCFGKPSKGGQDGINILNSVIAVLTMSSRCLAAGFRVQNQKAKLVNRSEKCPKTSRI